MSDAELWTAWSMWMGVAAAVILVAAALLIAIWLTARRILADAQRALAAAHEIQRNTNAIWALQTTNDLARGILERVESIEEKGGALVRALEGEPVRRG